MITSSDKKYLIVIGGATATGKTETAIQVATSLNAEIVSSDSRQFYREMSIGTAKPSLAQLAEVKHHFINSLSVIEDYSVGQFEKDALEVINELHKSHKCVILAGGSGLYINAVCQGFDSFPNVPENVKEQLEREYLVHGLSFIQKELQQLDPAYFAKVDIYNPRRILRALAVCRATGMPFSSYHKQGASKRDFISIFIQLIEDRAELYKKIDERVDAMLSNGLLEEAYGLLPHRNCNSLQTVGYQELFEYFDNTISIEKAIAKIKQNSRNYAKRQMTWFRKSQDWQVFHSGDMSGINSFIAKSIQ
jgi:tRNA dimethylallyltransferase